MSTTRNNRTNTKAFHRVTAGLVAAAALSVPLVSAPAFAAPVTTVTQASGMVVAQDKTQSLTAVPTAPGAITVTTQPGATVTLVPQNRSKAQAYLQKANANGKATFTKLIPGVTYQVTSSFDGQSDSTKVTAVTKPGKASALTVSTTNQQNTLQLSWKQRLTPQMGAVTYRVQAIPSKSTLPTITKETNKTKFVMSDLNTTTGYTFVVTPHNALADGGSTKAIMTRSLDDITGRAATIAEPVAEPTAEPKAEPTPEPKVNPAPAPQPAPQPAPKPSGPSTKTIYVCPAGYSESGDVCIQTRAYTFHTETNTQPYTYHSESRVETCAGPDCPGSRYINFGTDWSGTTCPNGGTMHSGQCLGWTDSTRTVTYQVKDAAPAGWTDNGSAYAQDVQVKDAMPAGYTDDGSQWVKTVAKEAKVVPA